MVLISHEHLAVFLSGYANLLMKEVGAVTHFASRVCLTRTDISS